MFSFWNSESQRDVRPFPIIFFLTFNGTAFITEKTQTKREGDSNSTHVSFSLLSFSLFLVLYFRGLDGAGKTTIMKKLKGEDITSISPTRGFKIETFQMGEFVSFSSFDTSLWLLCWVLQCKAQRVGYWGSVFYSSVLEELLWTDRGNHLGYW